MASTGDSIITQPSAPQESHQVDAPINAKVDSKHEETPQQNIDAPAAKKAKVEEAAPTPKERTPKKRGLSQTERTQREAEALIGDLKNESLDGPRRTRSQTRGTPAPSILEKISPARSRAPRKESTSPASATKKSPAAGGGGGRGRGRGAKKNVNASEDAPDAAEQEVEDAAPQPVNENGLPEVSTEKKKEPALDNQLVTEGDEDPWTAEARAEDEAAWNAETASETTSNAPTGGIPSAPIESKAE